MKKKISAFIALMVLCMINASVLSYNGWADEYLKFCRERRIMTGDENGDMMPDNNLTREQMTKIILNALNIDIKDAASNTFGDVSTDRWSYPYICKYCEYTGYTKNNFYPTQFATREEFLAITVKVAGYDNYTLKNENEFKTKISDWQDIDTEYYNLIATGYEKNFITGSNGLVTPKFFLTRAEACSMLYKILNAIENGDNKNEENPPEESEEFDVETLALISAELIGEPEATLEQAIQWAKNKNASEIFVEIAQYYWKYGELTGIRPDILYSQAAKETGLGKFGGNVLPEFYNWAGIKKYGATGGTADDFERFETPEDGVRGHFNHMCAYVGIDPIGEPHGRYKSVKSLTWAGTVKIVGDLNGRWCPDRDYAVSIVRDYLEPMKKTSI